MRWLDGITNLMDVFEQALVVCDGQGSLSCCSPWDHKESVVTEWLNWTELLFNCYVDSDSLWPHGLQHDRLPCPSPTPGAYSNSCPLSRWCHPTISSSVVPFSSCLHSFPAAGSFPMSQFFASGSQSIGALASVLTMNVQDWFLLGLTGWISLKSKRLSRSFSTPQFKSIKSLGLSFLYSPTLISIHDYWKNHSFD